MFKTVESEKDYKIIYYEHTEKDSEEDMRIAYDLGLDFDGDFILIKNGKLYRLFDHLLHNKKEGDKK